MAATVSTDFAFEPKVWQDHVRAYFDRMLVFGAIADRDDTLKGAPGETINFPYFQTIGAVEEPAENAALTVDNLSDDSFQATVKEVGKAVGVKKKAFKVSAARTERIIQEINEQMGRRHAEKIDEDLRVETEGVGNNTAITPTTHLGKTVRALAEMKVRGFGDKHKDAVALQIHSLDLLDVLTDNTAGFLKADANDPFFRVPGYQGTLLGMAVFEVDTVNGGTPGVCLIHKVNPYGFIVKQDMEMESDYDILAREWVFTSNEWYAVKSFHAKIDPLDKKTIKGTFGTP